MGSLAIKITLYFWGNISVVKVKHSKSKFYIQDLHQISRQKNHNQNHSHQSKKLNHKFLKFNGEMAMVNHLNNDLLN